MRSPKSHAVLQAALISAVCALIVTAAYDLYATDKTFRTGLYDQVIRLHITAESDRQEDQRAKLLIRDGVLGYLSSLTDTCANAKEAENMIRAHLADISDFVDEYGHSNGYGYSYTVSLTDEHFPVRDYGSCVFPAGEYHTLRITIGSGKGHNWWCVLYPNLCVLGNENADDQLIRVGVSEDAARYITSGQKTIRLRFKILEWLKDKTEY